ncbi:MAG: hypothetical protein GXO96_07215 [Nitrospirae bacterium]|nr:hypothetical protein [Candidatus Manganitrophaceae bacterium]
MAVEETSLKILKDAFHQFNTTSSELEKSYRLLKEEVIDLKKELQKTQDEKEVLREQAERNHRLAAVGEMSAKMAHELRNPLGSIELFASLLQKEVEKHTRNPEKIAWAKHLLNAVKNMDHSITNLLFFTRKPQAILKSVDLGQIISELIGFTQYLFREHHVEVFQKIDPELTDIFCDEDLIKQVLINLILNAMDAMPQGGALKITAHSTHDMPEEVLITISDTGLGIPEDALPLIFDPFFSTKTTGAGLGLAIAQNAVTAHQGVIYVNNRKDRGVTFTIRLPKHKEGRHAV